MDIPVVETHYEYQIIKGETSLPYVVTEQERLSPHLILHFDVNRTLIFSDAVQQQSAEDIIVNGLADRLEFLWDETLSRPINYTNFVKYYLFPNPEKSKEIKLKQKEATTRFLQFLEENDHPLYPLANDLFVQAKQALEKQETLVFTSFYNLLAHLDQQGISYTLVFRTFGSDIHDVAAELNERRGNEFLTDFHAFSQGVFKPKDGVETDFYGYLKQAGRHIAIQDDWTWWFKHGENFQYGKPFPMDLQDSTVCSLFFDDNARMNHDYPEINIVSPIDVSAKTDLSLEELIQRKRLFPVDTLEALCNENYFIELIQEMKNETALPKR